MSLPPLRALTLLLSLATLPSALSGCSSSNLRPGQVDVSTLPPYEGRGKVLYNDNIEPAALGLALDKPTFKGDPTFRERVQNADVVATVKVTTVTVGKNDDRTTLQLQFEQIGDPFKRKPAGQDELELNVPENSLAYPLVKLVQTRARGRTMIGMWKRYREGDEAVMHWYFAPDDPETNAAVKDALTLQELKK